MVFKFPSMPDCRQWLRNSNLKLIFSYRGVKIKSNQIEWSSNHCCYEFDARVKRSSHRALKRPLETESRVLGPEWIRPLSQGLVISSTSEGREQNEMYQYRVWNRVLDHYSELEPQLEFTNEYADSYTVTAPKLSHPKITGELLSAHRRKELVTFNGMKLIIEGIYVW